jgi:hypothetical protein
MKEVIRRLQKIAELNDDEFVYKIDIDVRHGGIWYEFKCYEESDLHEFVSGRGESPELAALNAMKQIEDALEQWGYTE